MLFDYLAVRLNGERAAGKKLTLNMQFTDLNRKYALTIENAVLNYAPRFSDRADATLTTTREGLAELQLGQATLDQQVAAGKLKLEGRKGAFMEFFGLLDRFDFWFNIVTP